jgi:predicted GTPase
MSKITEEDIKNFQINEDFDKIYKPIEVDKKVDNCIIIDNLPTVSGGTIDKLKDVVLKLVSKQVQKTPENIVNFYMPVEEEKTQG